jgi:uncharacterized protein YukE
VLDLLRLTWRFGGIESPCFIWIAAAAVAFFTILTVASLLRKARHLRQEYGELATEALRLRNQTTVAPRHGLPASVTESLREGFERHHSLAPAWSSFKSHLIYRRNDDGEDEVWIDPEAKAAFSDENTLDVAMNRAYYSAVPGIVTGVGLLFTFAAILVALLDVHLNRSSQQVEGLDQLIKGLSGKFLSSIAALGCATAYLFVEKHTFHKLELAKHRLARRIEDVFPLLTPSWILTELAHNMSEQSAQLKLFNADLSTKFKQSFSESVGPTLDRMVSAIEELNNHIRASEAQKQESITGSLEQLSQKLGASIAGTLDQVSRRFTEAISGSAREEFSEVISSLGSTATLLEKMNAQFAGTQRAMEGLIELSQRTTTEQIQLGRTQVEELTEVLRSLMAQLNDTAGRSMSQMAATLTAVVHDLSEKVTALGDRMTSSIIDSAGLAAGAASEVIDRAAQWSTKSADQLTNLLESYHRQLHTGEHLRETLDQALSRFRETLTDQAATVASMKELAANASAATASVAGAAKAIRDSQSSAERVTGLAATQIEGLAAATRQYQETWKQIHASMEDYQKIFARVNHDAGLLLDVVGTHLNQYRDTAQKGFENLAATSNDHFATATQRLGSSVEVLREYLDDLSDTLDQRKNAQQGRTQ